jgi:hypothetical protein
MVYADDMVLLAESAEHLQIMLDCLHSWCTTRGMAINVQKTIAVTFRHKASRQTIDSKALSIAGIPVPIAEEFRYLGLVFHSTKGVHTALEDRIGRAKKGLFAMYQRLRAISAGRSIFLASHLFHSLVEPILLYGSQVWALDLLVDKVQNLGQPDGVNKLDHFFLGFLRHLVGLRKSVPVPMIFMELGQKPLVDQVLCRLIRFWNKLVSMPEESWARKALLGEVHHNIITPSPTSWACSFFQIMLQLQLKPLSRQTKQPIVIPLRDFKQNLDALRLRNWQTLPLPDIADHGCVKRSSYWHHFVDPDLSPKLWRLPVGFKKLSAVIRFRLGCHDLAIEQGRWARPKIPRADRHCPHCRGTVQDEHHFVFDCHHNSSIRDNYPNLLGSIATLRDLFSLPDQMEVINYLWDLLVFNSMA